MPGVQTCSPFVFHSLSLEGVGHTPSKKKTPPGSKGSVSAALTFLGRLKQEGQMEDGGEGGKEKTES